MTDGGPLGPVPEPDAKDKLQQVAKAGMNLVPFAGGTAAELVDLVVTPSLERRRVAWWNKLGEAVQYVLDEGVDLDDLKEDEAFVSTVLHASRIAMGTHIEEKLELLKACIVNMAMPESPPDFLAMRFLRFVEELDPEHFLLLTYAIDPPGWYEANGLGKPNLYAGAPRTLLEQAGLGLGETVRNVALQDLHDRGLADTGSMGVMMTGSGAWGPFATALGHQLLDFVTLIDPSPEP